MARTSPLVSVVIPTYNYGQYVGETIRSVLNQTVSDLELIVIDDGSTDNSSTVIREVLASFPGRATRYIERENRGVCRTLNEGLALCSGTYFSYVGADDIWHPRKLELQIAKLEGEDKGCGASFTDCWVIDKAGKKLGRYGAQYKYRGGDIYKAIVWAKFQPPSPTVLFLRDAVESVGGFDELHRYEDRGLWIRMARKYQVSYVDRPLGYYRVHGENCSSNLPAMHAYSVAVVETAIMDDPELAPFRKELLADVDAFQAAAYYEELQMSEARSFALRALRSRPTNLIAWRTLVFSLLGRRAVSRIRDRRRSHDGSSIPHDEDN